MTSNYTEGHQVIAKRRPRLRQAKVPRRYQDLIDGVISIEDLDDEEIMRGQLRNSDGTFRGPHPQAIPWSMHEALRNAMSKQMERKLAVALPQMVDSLIRIANNPRAGAEARVKAISLAMDRALGKVVEKQEINQTTTMRWEEAASSGRIFVDLDPEEPESSEDSGDIVDADLVEETYLPEVPIVQEKRRPRPRTGVSL
jgi:hypothetical protein